MESVGVDGRIQCSREAYLRLCSKFEFEERKDVYAKGKGLLTTYLLSTNYYQNPQSASMTILIEGRDYHEHHEHQHSDALSRGSYDISDNGSSAPPSLIVEEGHTVAHHDGIHHHTQGDHEMTHPTHQASHVVTSQNQNNHSIVLSGHHHHHQTLHQSHHHASSSNEEQHYSQHAPMTNHHQHQHVDIHDNNEDIEKEQSDNLPQE